LPGPLDDTKLPAAVPVGLGCTNSLFRVI